MIDQKGGGAAVDQRGRAVIDQHREVTKGGGAVQILDI